MRQTNEGQFVQTLPAFDSETLWNEDRIYKRMERRCDLEYVPVDMMASCLLMSLHFMLFIYNLICQR